MIPSTFTNDLQALEATAPALWQALLRSIEQGAVGYGHPALGAALVAALRRLMADPALTTAEVFDALGRALHTEIADPARVAAMVADGFEWRIANRVDTVLSLCPDGFRPRVILDFGCDTGTIGAALGRRVGAARGDVYGCDLCPPSADVEWLPPDDLWQSGLDARFDLVIALVVMHHLGDADRTIRRFREVLRPGGVVVMREHDCRSTAHRIFFDALHDLWERVYRPDDGGMINARNYRALDAWDAAFVSAGFTVMPQTHDVARLHTAYRVYRRPGPAAP